VDAASLVCSVVHLGHLRVRDSRPYSGKVVGVAYAAGAVTHVLLFGATRFTRRGVRQCGLLVFAAVIGFAPIILAPLRAVLQAELLRPVPMK
jgi:hypothetical protein